MMNIIFIRLELSLKKYHENEMFQSEVLVCKEVILEEVVHHIQEFKDFKKMK
jgi:hypothetical protein